MRLLIFGAGGMLGHQLCRTLNDRFEIWGTVCLASSRSSHINWQICAQKAALVSCVSPKYD